MKKFVTLVMVAAAAISFTACGGAEEEVKTETESAGGFLDGLTDKLEEVKNEVEAGINETMTEVVDSINGTIATATEEGGVIDNAVTETEGVIENVTTEVEEVIEH